MKTCGMYSLASIAHYSHPRARREFDDVVGAGEYPHPPGHDRFHHVGELLAENRTLRPKVNRLVISRCTQYVCARACSDRKRRLNDTIDINS
jgi:hypothetical protein